ncbi:hypothetical protein K9M59_00985 [Candidatus Gracilibacteria bacterium]|nr:hypothetical protein [Candidatus Gracilibacteria bacterium]MCF7819146.1 hypothetical protein [Candidatus Gracilibacteria bacterium]
MAQKMKVVLLTTDYNIGANICIKAFLQNTLRKKYGIQVVGIVVTSLFRPWEKKSWRRMFRFFRQTGFGFAVRSITINIIQNIKMNIAQYFVADKKRHYFTFQEMARSYGFPIMYTKDINSPQTIDFIRKQKSDYLVSALLLQIVKKELLSIPKKGAINFHPALFQEHRGTFSSFWTLFRNRKKSGATVHFMNEEIDGGEIILQRNFFVHRSDSIHCINQKSARLGGNLLVKSLVKIKKQKAKLFWIKKASHLLSMPNNKQTEDFLRRGKKIIHWEDLFRI